MKTLLNIIATISAILLLWFAFSTVEVVAKNLDHDPQYSSTNVWVLLIEASKN